MRGQLVCTDRSGDGLALYEAMAESIGELCRILGFLPQAAEKPTLESAEIRHPQSEANFRARTDLAYLAAEIASGLIVRCASLHRTDWSIPQAEVAHWKGTSAFDNGHICESVEALVGLARHVLGTRRVEFETGEASLVSRRIAERCGLELRGIPCDSRLAPEGWLRKDCVYARLPVAARPDAQLNGYPQARSFAEDLRDQPLRIRRIVLRVTASAARPAIRRRLAVRKLGRFSSLFARRLDLLELPDVLETLDPTVLDDDVAQLRQRAETLLLGPGLERYAQELPESARGKPLLVHAPLPVRDRE